MSLPNPGPAKWSASSAEAVGLMNRHRVDALPIDVAKDAALEREVAVRHREAARIAPAEGPLGKGAETFFSASSSSPRATKAASHFQ